MRKRNRSKSSSNDFHAQFRALSKRWIADERGVTAVEYGLIITCVFLAAAGSINLFGASLAAMYTNLSDVLADTLF